MVRMVNLCKVLYDTIRVSLIMSDKFMFAPEIRFIIFSMSIYLPYFTHRDAHYGVITEVSTLRSAKRLALGFEWHP